VHLNSATVNYMRALISSRHVDAQDFLDDGATYCHRGFCRRGLLALGCPEHSCVSAKAIVDQRDAIMSGAPKKARLTDNANANRHFDASESVKRDASTDTVSATRDRLEAATGRLSTSAIISMSSAS
jgi:hypothetical protein